MMPRKQFPYQDYPPPLAEEGLGDPLEDVQSFNIIQFLSADQEFAHVLDDPLEPGLQNNQHLHQQHQMPPIQSLPLQQPAMCHQLQNMVTEQPMNPNAMYHLSSSRLPDSPPITDVSGNGSSASPSSNSEPYSPDTFNSYSVVQGNDRDKNGLILGVHDLQQSMMQQQFMPHQPQRMNQMDSPQGGQCFMSPYQQMTPSNVSQISPPPGMRPEPFAQRHYSNSQIEGIYNIITDGSLNSQNSEAPMSRKRSRLDSQPDHKFMPAMSAGPNPIASSPIDGAYPDENLSHQVIKFSKFQEEQWNGLFDANGRELKQLQVHVVADKGFNFASTDNCFVNQKKNHFQISVHVEACDKMPPKNVRYNGQLLPIREFKLSFCGVKAEMPTSEICIKQSRTDRKPHPHNPVPFEIQERRMTKVTVPRLHFSETTLNNQRKNYRPNPDQKYFLLCVRLLASISDDTTVLIQSYASDKVIVRATNPGSFEPPEADVAWNRNGDILFSNGPVSIGTEQSRAKLTISGDLYATGIVHHPSDVRLKEGIAEKETREALENLCKLRVVDYFYKPEIAEKWGLTEEQRKRTGLIAQELAAVLPDAVRDIGDYLTINESRVFYETVLATQELCRLTGDLDSKIDEKVDEISARLTRYAKHKKLLGSMASNLNGEHNADTKSNLSYSRSSLVSTAPSTKDRKDDRRKKTRLSRGDRPEPLCNSRLTQGTIITLVVVMAACLIAMSALYVLDWHNRNFGYHHVLPTQAIKEEPGKMVVGPESPNVPINQPNAPPLMPVCLTASCQLFCCTDQMKLDYGPVEDPHGEHGMADHRMIVERSAPLQEPDSFESGVSIVVPALNVSLDMRYCVDGSCSTRRGIYNLYIPISSYLPDAPIEVQITAPRSKVVNSCGFLSEFQHQNCPLSKFVKDDPYRFPSADQLSEDLFELSVGSFLQSAYRFRVAYTTEACFANEEHLQNSYEEYNLYFYRTCSMATPLDSPDLHDHHFHHHDEEDEMPY